MSFRRRTFPEVLDNLLTEIAGGVAAEEQPFPPSSAASAPFQQLLQHPPAGAVVSIYGSQNGESHLFRRNTDYKLLEDNQTVEWQGGADRPDAGTLVSINYFPQSSRPVLTDLQTGSIVRTLAESIGLEIARLYAQLEAVYQSGFVDTATGTALDNVVALLGIERVRGGHAMGEVRFTRAPGSRGTITIPAGTRVMTADGSVVYATTASVTMPDAQDTIRVVARDLGSNDPLPAGALTVLPVPIAGITTVTNDAPTAIATASESDVDLRTRAKNFLHGSERATLGALVQAVAVQQVQADVVERAGTPGYVDITPHATSLSPEQQQRLLTAIQDARPAGVIVTLLGVTPPGRVELQLQLTTQAGLTEPNLRAAHRAVREKLTDYFAGLSAKEPGSLNQIIGLVLSVPQVQDVRLVSARVGGTSVLSPDGSQLAIGSFPVVLGDLQIADANLPTLVNVVISAPLASAPADRVQVTAALTAALAYLNDLNGTALPPSPPAAERAKRTLSLGKLLLVIPLPLPHQTTGTLPRFDAGSGPSTLPTVTDIQPYQVTAALTLESGLTRLLERDGDSYPLAPSERLALNDVTIHPEGGHA